VSDCVIAWCIDSTEILRFCLELLKVAPVVEVRRC
jgi:hypothetical protein